MADYRFLKVQRSHLLLEDGLLGISYLDCGKQVYLGHVTCFRAGLIVHLLLLAYNRAAIKFRGLDADINFTSKLYVEMKNITKEEFVHVLHHYSNGVTIKIPLSSSSFK